MPARFILSLDCEGKWGVADHLNERHRRSLSDRRLHGAYRSIVALLDEYRIEATFAFVGLFAQSPSDFARLRPLVEQAMPAAPGFLAPALRDVGESGGAGWHGAHLVDMVTGARVEHEVALHGVTHVPWTHMERADAELELEIFAELAGPVRASRTFVYPRNCVAHDELLADHGFEGFRAARAERWRARAFLAEFDVFEKAERPLDRGSIVAIPAGFFLNWRAGLRALVPPAMTRLRARRLLRSAAANDGIVHYWLHPENIASAPSTLEILRGLIREVSEAREAGHCQVLTQLGYCRSQESLR